MWMVGKMLLTPLLAAVAAGGIVETAGSTGPVAAPPSAAATALAAAPNPAPAAATGPCTDVQIVFARGTGEAPGLGVVGTSFVAALTQDLAGRTVSSYAVKYAARFDQLSAGPGATDMTNHVTALAARCPNTRFVLGGYSQGASVTDIALGIHTALGIGAVIPADLAPRVAAVVVYGNPLALTGKHIPTASPTFGPRSKEFCAAGDPVCANGVSVAAHLSYARSGATTQGATFAAGLVG
jgi:cutinase